MKLLKITKTAWIAFIIAFLFTFLFQTKIHAQESNSSEQAVAKYNVTFPIAELGSCNNLAECKTYCDDPLHQTECVDFAKKKGFYKEKTTAVKNAINNVAKAELGCDSQESCRQFCLEDENKQKCDEFAKKYNLGGGKLQDPGKKDILTKAQEILGCASVNECKGVCEKEENKDKCDEFAKTVGLKGGVEKKGPGGCTTKETCSTYCSDPNNFEECAKFGSPNNGGFKGPGGCNSEESCKSFCETNSQKCTQIKLNPEFKAPPGPQSGFYNGATSSGGVLNREEFCKQNPGKCHNVPKIPVDEEYAKKCIDSGCKIIGTSCVCTTTTPFPAQSFSPKPYTTSVPKPSIAPEEYCRSKGCNWSNNSCQCTITYPKPSVTPNTVIINTPSPATTSAPPVAQ